MTGQSLDIAGSFINRMTARYRQFIERFLPPGVQSDRDAANQARVFLISHTIGPILGNTVPLALFAFDPTPGLDVAILAIGISLFWAFPFFLRRGASYHLLVCLSLVNLNFCIFWSCYHYGGVASPTLTWVLILPILSLFYIGCERPLQARLLAISALSFAVFLAVYNLVPPEPNDIPATAMLGLGAVSTVATLAYIATMAIYYARIFDAGVDLESDIRRRRAVTEELRRAVIAADRAGSSKAEFLARMSHELRTPLNAIIGYSQIIKEDALDSDDSMLTEDVDRILDAGYYLLRVINMILDLSKIEAGRMTFDPKPHDVADLLEAAAEAQRAAIEAAGITLRIDVAHGIDSVEVDQVRLLQVLDSIVDNAVRHTPDGAITLSASAGMTEIGRMLRIIIADTGTGMDPGILATLFSTFSTARNASTGRYGGTGLKLTVTSQLCRAMGGDIAVQSSPGAGSTFTVTLPMHADAAAPAHTGPVASRVTRPTPRSGLQQA